MRADIFIVRMLPFVHFVIFGITLVCAWCGITQGSIRMLLGENALYAAALFIISLSNKRYHCRWNRAMYIEMMAAPVVNYLIAKFHIITAPISMLITMSAIWSVTLILTAYLAIRHYMIPRMRKNGRI